ncbi:TOBE domain-containing protein, partial [Corallococcus exercitus]|uniref:TOBE domain-containing protein n=1 Tax=Corallococcus exercitus TaxID=2316736 RepID=UPI000EA3553D
ERPDSQFVSELLGTANIFEGKVSGPATDGKWNIELALPNSPVVKVPGPPYLANSGTVRVAVRPERLGIKSDADSLRARVRGLVFRGSYYAYELDLPGSSRPIYVYSSESTDAADDGMIGLSWPENYAILLNDGRAR